MEKFLTDRLQQKFQNISFSVAYPKPLLGYSKPLYSISSTSEIEHKNIAINLMKRGFLPDDMELRFLLQEGTGVKGFCKISSMGNMVFQIPIFDKKLTGSPICYSPCSMTEEEIILFRLWYEYFQQMREPLLIQEWNANHDEIIIYDDESLVAEQFIDKYEIKNDDKIRKLIQDRPDMLDSL